ncbi:MAG: S46 family peptidase [candidate division KSB1 bacterium]|jgi:hypothetical protein|nr:S46 family peptidase [candidate division KSB1 bacterium]
MIRRLQIILMMTTIISTTILAEEGMYPVSEIHTLDLEKSGLEIDPQKIYNPDGISLIDGICKIGGCTGSFVSDKGLILTNHHCAFGAIQAASSEEHDYLENGFLARDLSEEISAKGYTVRITESYKDVSAEVLSVVHDSMDYAQRSKAVEKKKKEIILEAEKSKPGIRAEVSEMFIGKTYVLFIYTYLKDIRLVYAPPQSIGNFGGEADNWIWPRHTGDFSIMRAYIGPDGKPADFSKNNKPYQPRTHLKVAPEGVSEGDFAFIFGYPGRTYRHRTSHFLSYEQEVRMPYVVSLYGWQIDQMKKISESGRTVALKHVDRIKGRANTYKNYRGKLLGLERLNLADLWRAEEKKLQAFIQSDKDRNAKFGTLLDDIGKVYADLRKTSGKELWLDYLKRSSIMMQFALTAYESAQERLKDDLERESSYMDRNFDRTKERLVLITDDYHEPTERILLGHMLKSASALPEDQRIPAIDRILKSDDAEKDIGAFMDDAFAASKLYDKNVLEQALNASPEELADMNDPFINFAKEIYPSFGELKEVRRTRQGRLDGLHGNLIDVKREFLSETFIPDANRTLRLTFGRIRGYSPRDAVTYYPITTLDGVIEKTTGETPFNTPAKIIELHQKKDYSDFKHAGLESVPVCILYDMDTTGGNSGSPVLDARGHLVGINFDRAFEATINDYAWSQDYSRSIAVDIRYVLWVTEKYGGASYLLYEMGVR